MTTIIWDTRYCTMYNPNGIAQIMSQDNFAYPIHCLLPHNRTLIKCSDCCFRIFPDAPLESEFSVRLTSLCPNDLEQSSVTMDLTTLGERLGFIGVRRLLFLHEKELRNSYLWLLEPEGLSDVLLTSSSILADESFLSSRWISSMMDAHIHADLEVRYIDATVGFGLFACCRMTKGTFIGEYVGVVYGSKRDDASTSNYSLTYPSCDGGFSIDATEYGNVTRFINHSSTRFNVEFTPIQHQGVCHVLCVVCQEIEPGSQLLVDYGPSFWHGKSFVSIE